MRPDARWRIGLFLALTLAGAAPGRVVSAELTFIARRADGTEVRGPLSRLGAGWEVSLGGEAPDRVEGADLLTLRQAGVALPPFRERPIGVDVEDVEQSARVIAAAASSSHR